MNNMIVTTGSRGWIDEDTIKDALANYDVNVDTIVHGGADGADTMVSVIAKNMGFQRIIVPANWKLHGKSAGIIRNSLMLSMFKPKIVLAFWNGKSKGTLNTIEQAEKMGLEVKIYSHPVRS